MKSPPQKPVPHTSRSLPIPNGRSVLHHSERSEQTVLVIDRSYSMEYGDYPPTRLAAALDSARLFAELRQQYAPDDRTAVVTFCETARRECGLLRVRDQFDDLLDAINTIQTGAATAIGAGLREAERVLQQSHVKTAVAKWFSRHSTDVSDNIAQRVILLTDGDQNAGINPAPVAKRLKRRGVAIDVIGIGGTPADVNEKLLGTLASVDPHDGRPRYRFIANRDELLNHFRRLASGLTR